jgi:hypothetical protein
MTDRHINISGGASGNFNTGDNVTQGNVTASVSPAALLTALAELRSQVPSDVQSRVDDLAEEATAAPVDKQGGLKAFTRLKSALSGISSVTVLLATIEDNVRKLFA